MGKFTDNMYTNPQQNQAMGNSYFNMLFKNLMGTGDYSRNEDASARGDASELEDERLRGLMGSSRKLRKGESMPTGAYSLADHPGLRPAVWQAETGNAPMTAGGSEKLWLMEQQDDSLRGQNQDRRKQWAAQQKRLMGWV